MSRNPVFDIETVIHELSEFGNLPWGMIDPKDCTKEWSFGRGGHGLPDNACHIHILTSRPDGSIKMDLWIIPEQIGAMLDIVRDSAVNSTRREIRYAIAEALGCTL